MLAIELYTMRSTPSHQNFKLMLSRSVYLCISPSAFLWSASASPKVKSQLLSTLLVSLLSFTTISSQCDAYRLAFRLWALILLRVFVLELFARGGSREPMLPVFVEVR